MKNEWEPALWTGLYIVALVLTWLTLFSIERFGGSEVRAWAPFLQAVLSAVAIFSAWWLQDRKHRMDANEAAHNAATVFAGVSRNVARIALFVQMRCRDRSLNRRIVEGHRDILAEDIQFLRSFPLTSVRDPEAVKAAIEFIRHARILHVEIGRACRRFEEAAESAEAVEEGEVLRRGFFDIFTRKLIAARSDFVALTGFDSDHPLAEVGSVKMRRLRRKEPTPEVE